MTLRLFLGLLIASLLSGCGVTAGQVMRSPQPDTWRALETHPVTIARVLDAQETGMTPSLLAVDATGLPRGSSLGELFLRRAAEAGAQAVTGLILEYWPVGGTLVCRVLFSEKASGVVPIESVRLMLVPVPVAGIRRECREEPVVVRRGTATERRIKCYDVNETRNVLRAVYVRTPAPPTGVVPIEAFVLAPGEPKCTEAEAPGEKSDQIRGTTWRMEQVHVKAPHETDRTGESVDLGTARRISGASRELQPWAGDRVRVYLRDEGPLDGVLIKITRDTLTVRSGSDDRVIHMLDANRIDNLGR